MVEQGFQSSLSAVRFRLGAPFHSAIIKRRSVISSNWIYDIADMHEYYNMDVAFDEITLDKEKAKKLLEFRINFLQEELNELKSADNGEDVVDALIDLCVVAVGTLDAFGVDSYQAWDNVLDANMNKKPGIKADRPNPLGLPDLIKPEGWEAPSHKDNIGTLDIIFKKPVCDL